MEYTPITLNHILVFCTVLGGAFAIYLNIRKLTDNIRAEVEWRITINNDLQNLIEKITELVSAHKDNTTLIRELIEARISLQHEIAALKKTDETMWKRIDEQKDESKQLKEDVQSLKFLAKEQE